MAQASDGVSPPHLQLEGVRGQPRDELLLRLEQRLVQWAELAGLEQDVPAINPLGLFQERLAWTQKLYFCPTDHLLHHAGDFL